MFLESWYISQKVKWKENVNFVGKNKCQLFENLHGGFFTKDIFWTYKFAIFCLKNRIRPFCLVYCKKPWRFGQIGFHAITPLWKFPRLLSRIIPLPFSQSKLVSFFSEYRYNQPFVFQCRVRPAVMLYWYGALIQFQPSAFHLWAHCVLSLFFSCVLDSSVFVLVSTSTGSSPETGKSQAKSTGDCTSKRYYS